MGEEMKQTTNLRRLNYKQTKITSRLLNGKLFNRAFVLAVACTFIDTMKYQVLMSTEPTLRLPRHLTCTISGNFNYRKNSETLSRFLPSVIKTELYV